jgi:hypothetical protein
MIKHATILLLAATFASASAQQLGPEPTQEQKINALKRAYQINGNSMTGWGSIDVDNEPTQVRVVPIVLDPPTPNPAPSQIPAQRKSLRKKIVDADIPAEHNICTRHKMHKVETKGGRSWRCRK